MSANFTFGTQVLVNGLCQDGQGCDLNGKFAFIVGDFRASVSRYPIRVVNDDLSNVFLVKPDNLTFISAPSDNVHVDPYESPPPTLSDANEDDDDSGSSSSSGSSHSTDMGIDTLTLKDNNEIDLKTDLNIPLGMTPIHEHQTMDDAEYLKRKQQLVAMVRPGREEGMDLDEKCSITSTQSVPIDCGLHYETQPVKDAAIADMEVSYVGEISVVINGIEIVVKHDAPQSDSAPIQVLDYESIVCLQDKTVLGRVDDILGNVKSPHYFVRIETDRAILLQERLQVGAKVYCVKGLAQFRAPPETAGERYSSAEEEDDEDDDEEESEDEDVGLNRRRRRKRRNSEERTKDRKLSWREKQRKRYGQTIRGGFARRESAQTREPRFDPNTYAQSMQMMSGMHMQWRMQMQMQMMMNGMYPFGVAPPGMQYPGYFRPYPSYFRPYPFPMMGGPPGGSGNAMPPLQLVGPQQGQGTQGEGVQEQEQRIREGFPRNDHNNNDNNNN